MSVLQRFKFDLEVAENGNWVEVSDGLFFKLRRTNSKYAQRVLARVNKALEGPRGRDVPLEVKLNVNRRFVAEGLIVDWYDEGNEIKTQFGEYSPENAVCLLETHPDILEDIFVAADNIENFRKKVELQVSGN